MQPQHVKIKSVDKVTHDVLRIVTEKPEKFKFIPGQAADVSIDKKGWKNKKNPFFLYFSTHDYKEQYESDYTPRENGIFRSEYSSADLNSQDPGNCRGRLRLKATFIETFST